MWRDHWLLVDELGHRPRVSPHIADKLEDWLHLISRGEGIDTAPAIIGRYYAWPDVAFVPLVDAAPSTLVIARRKDARDPLLSEFIELALEVSHSAALSDSPYARPVG